LRASASRNDSFFGGPVPAGAGAGVSDDVAVDAASASAFFFFLSSSASLKESLGLGSDAAAAAAAAAAALCSSAFFYFFASSASRNESFGVYASGASVLLNWGGAAASPPALPADVDAVLAESVADITPCPARGGSDGAVAAGAAPLLDGLAFARSKAVVATVTACSAVSSLSFIRLATSCPYW